MFWNATVDLINSVNKFGNDLDRASKAKVHFQIVKAMTDLKDGQGPSGRKTGSSSRASASRTKSSQKLSPGRRRLCQILDPKKWAEWREKIRNQEDDDFYLQLAERMWGLSESDILETMKKFGMKVKPPASGVKHAKEYLRDFLRTYHESHPRMSLGSSILPPIRSTCKSAKNTLPLRRSDLSNPAEAEGMKTRSQSSKGKGAGNAR